MPTRILRDEPWVQSSAVHPDDEDYVEVRLTGAVFITVQAGSSPNGPQLVFSPYEWAAFVRGVKAGEFDLPADHGWPEDAIALQDPS